MLLCCTDLILTIMESTFSCLPGERFDPDYSPTFNVVIAYEDFDTGTQAKKTYDFLVENLNLDCEIANQMWKFDVLNIAKLREMAVKDAMAADVIFISSHGGRALPQAVKRWIEDWLQRGSNAIALVALFGQGVDQSGATRAYLAEAARRAKVGFFAQPDEWPERSDQIELAQDNHAGSDVGQRTFSTLVGAMQRDVGRLHWSLPDR